MADRGRSTDTHKNLTEIHPQEPEVYKAKHKIRVVTAASLFDGHDAAINLIRRLLQDSGAEVIHLGHNRSVREIVQAAIQEDVQGICVSSYQGGHMEFFKYMKDMLDELGASHIKIFGGGGGVIIPPEIKELEEYGIEKIFSPDDGRVMGLQGMINYILEKCDFSPLEFHVNDRPDPQNNWESWKFTAGLITAAEESIESGKLNKELEEIQSKVKTLPIEQRAPIIGVTGTGGAGKSSLVDELIRRFLMDFPDKKIAIVSVDPSKRKTGGALLGDRIRMNSVSNSDRTFMRSMATRHSHKSLSAAANFAVDICQAAGFDLIIIETSGIGQADTEIVDIADFSIYVMTADYGAPSQLEKIGMLDYADIIAINKFEKRGSLDALRHVRKQYRRSHKLFDTKKVPDEKLPIYGTQANRFNDPGINKLYLHLTHLLNEKWKGKFQSHLEEFGLPVALDSRNYIIPPERERYLAEIADTVRSYKKWVKKQAEYARKLWHLQETKNMLLEASTNPIDPRNKEQPPRITKDLSETLEMLDTQIKWYESQITPENLEKIKKWPEVKEKYAQDTFTYKVRGRDITVPTYTVSLAHSRIPKVALPEFKDWGELLRWQLLENVPGEFPFTAGVYPFKRTFEDPTRMFAGEGPPERTNKRFHFLSQGQPFARLSTAFDSVTLYGADPDERPDIYGKIGESGVSICTVEDMERLYAGFDLCDPRTSVSMTINGPAPIILAFFMVTAARQQARKWVVEQGLLSPAEAYVRTGDGRYGFNVHSGEYWVVDENTPPPKSWEEIRKLIPDEKYQEFLEYALQNVRGTVQADILKEDQAQNTCIFSTDFSIRMMGDIQEAFIKHKVRNFYSVSISGYHIAEAGANPITQLAFTLANGFTYVEYYLSRGMHVDDFAPNLSFFFSNGMDPEYSVIGRVARRIWAIAMKNKYGANKRSQMLKYHIQTSGRSLHAQEVAFNDIRTTLQALLAIYDNCNSLHTNAYDEAITTPTEESVRRALAIQLIINKEFGLAKNENPNQGSFIIEYLTDLVEEAVLDEFQRLSDRGGVLGAMEMSYQRSKIQDESLYYEQLKHSGELPIIGVNTFIDPNRDLNELEVRQLSRATKEEKDLQIRRLREFQQKHAKRSQEELLKLKKVAVSGGNIFEQLLETVQYCSLGQITQALYEVGGQYRRNL